MDARQGLLLWGPLGEGICDPPRPWLSLLLTQEPHSLQTQDLSQLLLSLSWPESPHMCWAAGLAWGFYFQLITER